MFVLIETWLVPVEGYLVDKFGPRWVVLGGGILVGIAWVMNSMRRFAADPVLRRGDRRHRHRLRVRHLRRQRAQVVPGTARHRRRAHGAGFGAGAALTIVPISHMISSAGYQHAFLVFGLIQGGIVFVLAWLLLVPPPTILAKAPKSSTTAHGYTPTRGAAQPGVLRALPHVRADRRGRPHHGRIDGADRQGLRHRRRRRWICSA